MKPIHFLRAGKHTDSGGTEIEFAEDVLRQIAEGYNPERHEAPITVGHPKDNAPAYGWIGGVRYSDGNLYAEPRQVNADFAEMVKGGAFRKVSASLYTPAAPQNPTPGSYYLRHIGFLGAQPPAIKGLAPVGFAEDEAHVVELAEEFTVPILARLFRGLRDALIESWGQDKADQALPGFLVEDLEAEARRPPETEPEPAAGFAEGGGNHDDDNPEGDPMGAKHSGGAPAPGTPNSGDQGGGAPAVDYAEQQRQLEERERQLAEREAQLRRQEAASFAEGLVAEGRLLPAQKDTAVGLLVALPAEGEAVSYAEGNEQKQAPPAEAFRAFLRRLPKAVEYGEKGDEGPGEQAGGEDLDADDLTQRALEYREAKAAQGITVTAAQAVAAVRKGQKAA